MEREIMEYDVVVVGGGPSGLATAIRFAQLNQKNGTEHSICLLEKGSEIGAHILSGNVFQPNALDELIPDWKEKNSPIQTKVNELSLVISIEMESLLKCYTFIAVKFLRFNTQTLHQKLIILNYPILFPAGPFFPPRASNKGIKLLCR